MKKSPVFAVATALCLAAPVLAGPPKGTSSLEVLPAPGVRGAGNAAKRFAPYELPFRLPAKLADNALYESAPFYAVVLRRDADPPCDAGEYSKGMETFRIAAQKRFPDRKVFAAPECPDMGAVSYKVDGTPEGYGFGAFVAVYAGRTEAEVRAVLAKVKANYPKAEVKRMRVGFSRIVQ
jgi:hypothetical protein